MEVLILYNDSLKFFALIKLETKGEMTVIQVE